MKTDYDLLARACALAHVAVCGLYHPYARVGGAQLFFGNPTLYAWLVLELARLANASLLSAHGCGCGSGWIVVLAENTVLCETTIDIIRVLVDALEGE